MTILKKNATQSNNVTIKAGQSITLNPGFTVNSNASLSLVTGFNAVSVKASSREYAAGIEYLNGQVEAIYFPDGRVYRSGSTWRYEYVLTDHLGNNRLSFYANGSSAMEIQQTHYYPFGMEMEGVSTVNAANKYKFNGIERNEDFGLNIDMAFFRSYDASIGRWWQMDPKAESFSDLTPYSGFGGNPILLVDPMGDTTRVYGLGGNYLYTINDNLPNEDHFLTDKQLEDVNCQTNCVSIDQQAEYARSVSEFYLGADTRQQIQDITALSDKIEKEQAFVLTVGKDRQLDVTNISKFVIFSSSQIKGMPEGILNSGIKGIVGSGHTHPTEKGRSSQYFPSFMPGVTTPSSLRQMSDYAPVMANPFNKSVYGNHLAVVSSKVGMTVYTTGIPLKFIRNNDQAFTYKGRTIR